MAPPNTQKRTKGVSIYRPFVYGTTSHKFSPKYPKPEGTPEEHTHQWTVFVKGVDDVDITYWCRKVQFKLHDTYPQHLRSVENVKPGDPFQVTETGWGGFDIQIKIYYDPIANEKAQSFWHRLVLEPYGDDQLQFTQNRDNEVRSWREKQWGKGESDEDDEGRDGGQRGERTVFIPMTQRPGQPFSKDGERAEVKKLAEGKKTVDRQNEELRNELREKEEEVKRLKAELETL
ncbi:histone acetyltransferase subunit [Botrytis cinerea]